MPRGRQSPVQIALTPPERAVLQRWTRAPTIAAVTARQARQVLLRADGLCLAEISRLTAISRHHVRACLQRFLAHRLAGITRPRGRRARLPPPRREVAHV